MAIVQKVGAQILRGGGVAWDWFPLPHASLSLVRIYYAPISSTEPAKAHGYSSETNKMHIRNESLSALPKEV